VTFFIDQSSFVNGDDFVHTIGKLVAAILDMDGGLAMGDITPVDICDAGHLF